MDAKLDRKAGFGGPGFEYLGRFKDKLDCGYLSEPVDLGFDPEEEKYFDDTSGKEKAEDHE